MATEDLNNEIDRFISDTEKTNIFANGDESAEYIADDGEKVPSIRKFLSGLADGVKGYDTLEQLMLVQGVSVGQLAKVTNDPELENNGDYKWNGSAWVQSVDKNGAKINQINENAAQGKFPSGWGDYADSVVQKGTGAILWGVSRLTGRYAGTPEFIGRNIGERVLDHRYAEIEYDSTPERNIISAKTWDGRTLFIGGPTGDDLDLFTVQTPQGKMQVKLATDTQIVSIGSAFNSFKPSYASGKISYKEQATVSTYTRYKEYPFSAFPVTATTLTHFIGYGESLAVGANSDPTVVTPPLPERLFMFNAGILSLGREQGPGARHIVIDDSGLQVAEPAYSQIRECPVLAAAYQYALDNPSKVILASQHGYGGALIAGLVRGNESYDNLIHAASMARAMAESNGMAYEIAPISFIQGTNDQSTTTATYRAMLDTLWSQLNEDLKAVSGQSDDILLLIEQTLAGNSNNDGSLGFAQVEHALANPAKFHCSNPRYGYTYLDESHLDGTSYVSQGASQGFACRSGYEPLYPISAVRTGTTVVVTFNEGDLVMDTTDILPPTDGNFGFHWQDSTNSAAITDVSLSDDTVTITLDQVPTGANPQIRIADREDADAISPANVTGTGKRCCLRTASLGNDVLGNPVYKRAALFRINVT